MRSVIRAGKAPRFVPPEVPLDASIDPANWQHAPDFLRVKVWPVLDGESRPTWETRFTTSLRGCGQAADLFAELRGAPGVDMLTLSISFHFRRAGADSMTRVLETWARPS